VNLSEKKFTYIANYYHRYSILAFGTRRSVYEYGKVKKKAIKRYLNGESPKEIYQSLGKGKTWFFKWLKLIILLL